MGRTKRHRQNVRSKNNNNNTNILPSPEEVNLCRFMKSIGWKNDTHLKIRKSLVDAKEDRGLYSTHTINADSCLITIPFNALITIEVMQNDTDFVNLLKGLTVKRNVTMQSMLAMYLVYHKSCGDRSPLKPYIDSLPTYFTNPYFCTANELQYLTEDILSQTVAQNARIKSAFTTFSELLQAGVTPFLNLNVFKWAYFVVNTRSIYLAKHVIESITQKNSVICELLSDDPCLALAPLLDLFNHSDFAETIAQVPPAVPNSTPHYELITRTKCRRYDELFISYGCHSNSTLLIEYGFHLPANRFDSIQFTLGDVSAFLQRDRKFQHLCIGRDKFKHIRDHNLETEMFIDRSDVASHNLLVVLTLLFVVPNFVGAYNQAAFGLMPILDDVRTELLALIAHKRNEIEHFANGLKSLTNLSASGVACHYFYIECLQLLDDVVAKLENDKATSEVHQED